MSSLYIFTCPHLCFLRGRIKTHAHTQLGRNSCPINLRRLCNSSLGVCDLDAQSLGLCNDFDSLAGRYGVRDLGSVCAVVHEQQFNVSGVVDEEGLVAGGHHVSCLLVGAETNLSDLLLANVFSQMFSFSPSPSVIRLLRMVYAMLAVPFSVLALLPDLSPKSLVPHPLPTFGVNGSQTYRRHDHLTLEPSSNSVVNTLWFPPCRWHTFVGIGLVSVPFLGVLLDDSNVFLCGHHLFATVSMYNLLILRGLGFREFLTLTSLRWWS